MRHYYLAGECDVQEMVFGMVLACAITCAANAQIYVEGFGTGFSGGDVKPVGVWRQPRF